MGHLLTADGVVKDPNKVRAIRGMPTPTGVKSLNSWYGYLIPSEVLTKLV